MSSQNKHIGNLIFPTVGLTTEKDMSVRNEELMVTPAKIKYGKIDYALLEEHAREIEAYMNKNNPGKKEIIWSKAIKSSSK